LPEESKIDDFDFCDFVIFDFCIFDFLLFGVPLRGVARPIQITPLVQYLCTLPPMREGGFTGAATP
jgi:hypothetical protein